MPGARERVGSPLLHRGRGVRVGGLLPAELPLRPSQAHRGQAPGQGVNVSPFSSPNTRPFPRPRHRRCCPSIAQPPGHAAPLLRNNFRRAERLPHTQVPTGSAPERGWGLLQTACFRHSLYTASEVWHYCLSSKSVYTLFKNRVITSITVMVKKKKKKPRKERKEKQETVSGSMDVVTWKLLCIAVQNMKWCSRCGKQCGVSLNIKHRIIV